MKIPLDIDDQLMVKLKREAARRRSIESPAAGKARLITGLPFRSQAAALVTGPFHWLTYSRERISSSF
jgi:hypothetical protein